jgi:hypothetical protein
MARESATSALGGGKAGQSLATKDVSMPNMSLSFSLPA